jgi:hypothetical protein
MKANILASLDYDVKSDTFIQLEREFFETTDGFTDFINGDYLHHSTEGGDAELVLLSSCLNTGIVLFDADKKIPMIDQGRRSLTRGGRLMDFLSIELFCPSSSPSSTTYSSPTLQTKVTYNADKQKSARPQLVPQTIVLLRWMNHYTLLSVTDINLFQDVLSCRSTFKYILDCNATLCVYAKKIVDCIDGVVVVVAEDDLQTTISKFLRLFWDDLPLHLSSFILIWNDLTNYCESKRISVM